MGSDPALPLDAGPYMPHGEPMVLVDKLVSVGDISRVTARLDSGMLFMDHDGVMDNIAYVELVAQAVALKEGYQKSLEGKKIKGFLVGVKKFKIFRKAKAGDELQIDVESLLRFSQELTIILGTVYIDGNIVAQGEIKIWENA